VKKIFIFEPMYDKLEKVAKEHDVDTVAMIHDILMQALGNYEQAKAKQGTATDSMIVVPKGGMGEVAAQLKAQGETT
jgi:DNA-binding protein H-NS